MLDIKAKLFAPKPIVAFHGTITDDALVFFKTKNWDTAREYITDVYNTLYPGEQLDYELMQIIGTEE